MSDDKKKKKLNQPSDTKLKSEGKQARLSEALRANLRRRKEQARDRKTPDAD